MSYYFINEEGNLDSSFSSEVLSDKDKSLYPDSSFDLPLLDALSDVSSGDSFIPSVIEQNVIVSNDFDFDEFDSHMFDLLAQVPAYDIYPSTAAIQVFQDVLLGLHNPVGYVIQASDTASDVTLYYSEDYDVSGTNIVLRNPVTACRYFTYRSNSTTYYRYTVTTLSSDTSFSLGTQLVYTNLVEGYPALQRDSLQYDVPFYLFSLVLLVAFFGILLRKLRR